MSNLPEVAKKLIVELRKIDDSREFVEGVISNCENEMGWEKALQFLEMAKERKDTITHDDMLWISLSVGRKYGKK